MRFVLCVLVLAACAGKPRRATTPPPRPEVPYWVAAEYEHKIAPYIKQQWRAHGLMPGEHMPVVITFTGTIEAATEALLAFGAVYVQPVTSIPAESGEGGLRVTPTKGRTAQVMAMPPNEALRFVVVPPWVVRLDGASAWPFALDVPEDVQRRIDPSLYLTLMKVGKDRPYSVRGFARVDGCFDTARRDEMRSLGAIVGSVISNPACTYTSITFEIPLNRLLAFASLRWVAHIEGDKPVMLELQRG